MFELFVQFYFRWEVHLQKENCAFAKAASIPARRQSEDAGPRIFGLILRHCPPSRIFFQIFEHSTKVAFAKTAFDSLGEGVFRKRGLFKCVHFLEILKNPEFLEISREPSECRKRRETDHFFRDSLEIPPAKRPFCTGPFLRSRLRQLSM